MSSRAGTYQAYSDTTTIFFSLCLRQLSQVIRARARMITASTIVMTTLGSILTLTMYLFILKSLALI